MPPLKRIAKTVLRPDSWAYRQIHRRYHRIRYPWWPTSLKSLDPVMSALSATCQDVRFVQIGANDGMTNDPIQALVKQDGWKGILVEPNPVAFARLQANYAETSGLLFKNVAVAAEAEEKTFYYFEREGYDQLSSFSLGHIKSHRSFFPDLEEHVKETRLPCTTFSQLLAEQRWTHLDLLQIDTEGYDYTLLKSLDYASCKPRAIGFESAHLYEHFEACHRLLYAQGYRVFTAEENALALQPDLLRDIQNHAPESLAGE